MSDQKRIPQHVAIIMDGNGRWAELRGKERYEGHAAGVEPVRASLRAAARWGVKYLTLYAFSTENWGRPAEEVDSLMELFCKSVVNETPELIRQGVEVRMIGDRSRFSEKVRSYLAMAEEQTAGGRTLTLILALNYSSRSEITHAVQQIAQRVEAGQIAPSLPEAMKQFTRVDKTYRCVAQYSADHQRRYEAYKTLQHTARLIRE